MATPARPRLSWAKADVPAFWVNAGGLLMTSNLRLELPLFFSLAAFAFGHILV